MVNFNPFFNLQFYFMRKLLLLMAFLSSFMFTQAQSISLGTGNEYCPETIYEFTVTLPGPYHSISATQFLITNPPYDFTSGEQFLNLKESLPMLM